MEYLKVIGALDENENLTLLGMKIIRAHEPTHQVLFMFFYAVSRYCLW